MSSCSSPVTSTTLPTRTRSALTTLQPFSICNHETGSVTPERLFAPSVQIVSDRAAQERHGDIRAAFARSGGRIASVDLAADLNTVDERPCGGSGDGVGLKPERPCGAARTESRPGPG